jgi:hypothetical protein
MRSILPSRHPRATPTARPTGVPARTLAETAGRHRRAHADEVMRWLRAQDAPAAVVPAPGPAPSGRRPAPVRRAVQPRRRDDALIGFPDVYDVLAYTAVTRRLVQFDVAASAGSLTAADLRHRDILALVAPICQALAAVIEVAA